MADILRGYGIARESAYFKQEQARCERTSHSNKHHPTPTHPHLPPQLFSQEAEIQRHRSKLIKEGKIEAGDGPAKIRRDMSLKESAKAYEVVPEILGQGARIDDPHAAAKREFQRRRKAQLPPLSAAELEEYATRTALKSDALSGVVPRIDLRRNRYNAAAVYEHASSGAVMHRTLPPEVQEVAGRAYNASMRAAGYGSLLAITGVALATAYTLQQHDITDTHALRYVLWWDSWLEYMTVYVCCGGIGGWSI